MEYPTWQPIAKILKEKYAFKVVFDYLDEYEGFTNTNANPIVVSGTKWLKQNCDLAIGTSDYLYNRIGDIKGAKALIKNGADSEYFMHAHRDSSVKNERPIVGYYGAIADWFDTDIVEYAAEKHPEYVFRLVGDYTYADVSKLQELDNVELPGEVAYSDLWEELSVFDVCIIPFDASLELIKATNPVKFYEYLSAGKKVVATEIPELAEFDGKYVLMDNSKEGFAHNIEKCINGTDALAGPEELMSKGRANDWLQRVDDLIAADKALWPSVSVVILTWNNAQYNVSCVQSVYEKSMYPNLEVIVVDNDSSDDTVERMKALQTRYPSLRVVCNDENLGFAGV